MRRLTVICCAIFLVSIATENVRANPYLNMAAAKAAQQNLPNTWLFVTKDNRYFVIPEKMARKSAKLRELMDQGSQENPVSIADVNASAFSVAMDFLDARLVKGGVEKWKIATYTRIRNSDLSELFKYVKLSQVMGIPALLNACIDLHRQISDAMFVHTGFTEKYWDFADEFEKMLSLDQRQFAISSVLQDWSRIMPTVSSIHLNPFISTLAFDAQGKRIAIGTREGDIQIWSRWEAKAPAQLSAINFDHHVLSLAFCPKENCLVAAGGNFARVFKLDRIPKPLATFKSASLVESVALSIDGRYLAMGMENGTATLFLRSASSEGEHPRNFRHGFGLVTAIAFSPDSKLVATGSSDGNVKVWNIADLDKPLVTFLHTGALSSLVFSPDSKMLLTSSRDKNAQIWVVEANPNPHRKVRFVHSVSVDSAAYSPNARWVATGIFDEPAKLWLADGPKKQKPIVLSHLGKSSAFVAFSPDARYLAVASSHEVLFALLPDMSRIDFKMAYLIKYVTANNIRAKKDLPPFANQLISQNPYVEALLFSK